MATAHLVLEPESEKKKTKKKYSNTREPVPIRATQDPSGWPFIMRVADPDF